MGITVIYLFSWYTPPSPEHCAGGPKPPSRVGPGPISRLYKQYRVSGKGGRVANLLVLAALLSPALCNKAKSACNGRARVLLFSCHFLILTEFFIISHVRHWFTYEVNPRKICIWCAHAIFPFAITCFQPGSKLGASRQICLNKRS